MSIRPALHTVASSSDESVNLYNKEVKTLPRMDDFTMLLVAVKEAAR